MVTLKYYLDTFSTVMPKRIEVINSVWRSKAKLDYNLSYDVKTINLEKVKELQKLVGESTFFKKPEKDDVNQSMGQSLRHYTWKASKSIGLLGENMGLYLGSIDKKDVEELDKNGIPLTKTVNDIMNNSKKASEMYMILDGALITEAECLNKMCSALILIYGENSDGKPVNRKIVDEAKMKFNASRAEYLATIANEGKFKNEIVKIMRQHAAQTESLLNSVNKYVLKRNVHDRNDAIGHVANFLTWTVGLTFFISFGVTAYQSIKEGQPIRPDTITTSIALIEATIMTAQRFILGNMQSEPSKKMLVMLQKINWLA